MPWESSGIWVRNSEVAEMKSTTYSSIRIKPHGPSMIPFPTVEQTKQNVVHLSQGSQVTQWQSKGDPHLFILVSSAITHVIHMQSSL